MNPNGAQEYLKAKVLTATPEQLQLMLFDGAVKFAEKAKLALAEKNYEQSYHNLSKAEKILLELNCSLKPKLAPELCKNLSAIYTFCYRKLIEANTTRAVEPIDEVIGLMKYQRETWVLLMQQLAKAKAGEKAKTIPMPAPDERMEQSFRISA
jgi:flagellar protein FliS